MRYRSKESKRKRRGFGRTAMKKHRRNRTRGMRRGVTRL